MYVYDQLPRSRRQRDKRQVEAADKRAVAALPRNHGNRNEPQGEHAGDKRNGEKNYEERRPTK